MQESRTVGLVSSRMEKYVKLNCWAGLYFMMKYQPDNDNVVIWVNDDQLDIPYTTWLEMANFILECRE